MNKRLKDLFYWYFVEKWLLLLFMIDIKKRLRVYQRDKYYRSWGFYA